MNDSRWYLIICGLLEVGAAYLMWELGGYLLAVIYAAGVIVLIGLLVYDFRHPN